MDRLAQLMLSASPSQFAAAVRLVDDDLVDVARIAPEPSTPDDCLVVELATAMREALTAHG